MPRTADEDRRALARRLRENILARLAGQPGQWVPRRELHALTPPVTVHVTEAGLGDVPFGFDDPRGSAWDEQRPDDDLVIEVTGALRRELRIAERVDRTTGSEYLLYDDRERVSLREIAARLRVERDTADHWRIRRVLPEPDPADAEGRRPRWRWGVIREWAIGTGRGPK